MGRVKGRGERAGTKKRSIFFSPPPPPSSFFALTPTVRVTIFTLPNLPLSQNQRQRLHRSDPINKLSPTQIYACTAGQGNDNTLHCFTLVTVTENCVMLCFCLGHGFSFKWDLLASDKKTPGHETLMCDIVSHVNDISSPFTYMYSCSHCKPF